MATRLTNADIDALLDNGWIRIGDYVNSWTKFALRCPKGHSVEMLWNSYRQGARCSVCAFDKMRLTNSDIDSRLDLGWVRLGDYKNNHTPILLRCPQGHQTAMRWGTYHNGGRCRYCANVTFGLNHRGENNPNWRNHYTDYDRVRLRLDPNYPAWRTAVFERDSYKCQACGRGGKNLHAHHIFNYQQHPELRIRIDNGITFCRKCHRYFHRLYGIHNNNLQQVLDFIKLVKSDDLSDCRELSR